MQKILEDFKRNCCTRNEPILVGGGVITDLAGFAAGLYHRGTPYIDAGPSVRTCCDGDGYKNLFGTFHPPVFTITDRHFFGILRTGWLPHGLSEIRAIQLRCPPLLDTPPYFWILKISRTFS